MSNYFSHSCNAMTTGYDGSGMFNYAYSSSVAGFSLAGDKSFTFEYNICFRNIQGGSILRQEGIFDLRLENRAFSIDAPGFYTGKIPPNEMEFFENIWYLITVSFDRDKLRIYVDGFPAISLERQFLALEPNNINSLDFGYKLDAYIKQIILYPVVLTDEEIRRTFMNGSIRTDEAAAWFIFSETQLKDRSGNNAPISVKGYTSVINISRVLYADGGVMSYVPFNLVNPDDGGYTWIGKIYPLRSSNSLMCIASNSDSVRDYGWMLYLEKESDDVFCVCLRTGGMNGTVIRSEKKINTFCWSDVGWRYDDGKITLFVNGESDLPVVVSLEALQGDGRTSLCGLFHEGKLAHQYAYRGYIAHSSAFVRSIADADLESYMKNQPYVFDNGIAQVFDFNDDVLTEKCSLQQFSLSGKVSISWAENTNALTDPQGFKPYFPEADGEFWTNLSDELKWEVELFGTICNSYIQDVLVSEFSSKQKLWDRQGAEYIVENILKTPAFRNVAKSGISVTTDAVCKLLKATTKSGATSVFSGIIGALGSGVAGALFLKVMSSVAVATGIAMATLLITKCVAKIITVIKEACEKRPDSKIIKINSIEFNHDSNPNTGGIHIRKNSEQSVVPPEWSNTNSRKNPAYCAYITPIVIPHITVCITYTPEVGTIKSISGILYAIESGGGSCLGNVTSMVTLMPFKKTVIKIPLQKHKLNNNPGVLSSAILSTWEWKCNVDNEVKYITLTYHTVYKLLGIPNNPWKFHRGAYFVNAQNYPWTEAMDVAIAMYENGQNYTIGGEILARIACGLNADGGFQYEGNSYYSNFNFNINSFNLDAFQNAFNDRNNNHLLVNCSDCANIVSTYANLYGENLSQAQLSGFPTGALTGFNYNPIIPIGRHDWEGGGDQDGYSYHQVVINSKKSPFLVTDACLKIDIGQYPRQLPNDNIVKTATVAVNMQFTDNLCDIVNIEEPYNAILYRERLVQNDEECFITNMYDHWTIIPITNQLPIEIDEYHRRVQEYYGIKIGAKKAIKESLIPDFALRLHEITELTCLSEDGYFNKYHTPFTYKQTRIQITHLACETVDLAKIALIYILGGISRFVDTAEEKGIDLGEKAFAMQDNEGLFTCIILYRKNVVLQLMCSTTKSVDLLPLAYKLDKQMMES